MRAADAKPHIGKRVCVRVGDLVLGPDGSLHASKLTRDGLVLVDKLGTPKATVRLANIDRISDFVERAPAQEQAS